MLDLIRRIVARARRPFVRTAEQDLRCAPTSSQFTEAAALSTSPSYKPRWCAELLHAEEAALVRLYVVPGRERARLRVEPRWRPLTVEVR